MIPWLLGRKAAERFLLRAASTVLTPPMTWRMPFSMTVSKSRDRNCSSQIFPIVREGFDLEIEEPSDGFGLVAYLAEGDQSHAAIDHILIPELPNGRNDVQRGDRDLDYWGLGVLLFELLGREVPAR